MSRFAIGARFWPAVLVLLLAADGAGLARPAGAGAQRSREASSRQASAGPERTPLRVTLGRASDDHCGSLETQRLIVAQGNREIATHDYCSAYNRGGVSMVTDVRGAHYILLTYGEGHGTHAVSDWLTIFRLNGEDLQERANLLIREPIGIVADHMFNYRTRTPPGGGLIVSGAWIIDDPYPNDHEYEAPERSRTAIALDTAS